MRAWRVILTSVVVHAGAFAILATWRSAVPVRAVVSPPVARMSIPPTVPEVIDMVVLDDSRVARSEPAHVRTVASASVSRPAGPRPVAETAAAGVAVDVPVVSQRGLGMRGPELHPSDAALEHIADAPGHVGATATSSIALDSAANGRQTHAEPGTTMIVGRDGTAHFHDSADIDAQLDLTPDALRGEALAFKEQTKAWLTDPESFKRAGRTQDLPRTLQAVEVGCSSWGDAMCDATDTGAHDKLARKTTNFTRVPILSGNLDITSYLMRKLHIGDPLASKKLQLLDQTRDQRAESGAIYKQDQLDHAAIAMQHNLERLWASTQNPDERRAVLFEMWDECAEGETPLGIAGESARKMVIGWIRANLPNGFTASDIAALDARRSSKQHFVPY